eukprot:15009255-Alexandrium_andersonii.AAC.1
MGWPLRRGRSWRTAVDLSKWAWLGPVTPDGLQRDFHELFATTCELRAEVFYRDSADKELAERYISHRGRKQGIFSKSSAVE